MRPAIPAQQPLPRIFVAHAGGFGGNGLHGHPVLWFLLLVLFVSLVALAVYALVQLIRRPAAGAASTASRVDAAVESVRMRYARGEIDRDEFVRVSTDLGAPPTPAAAV